MSSNLTYSTTKPILLFTSRHICHIIEYMTFKDYNGTPIELSADVWENHIKVNHPEIDVSEIELTLTDPDEVWVSQQRGDTELFYKRKKTSLSGKVRYWMIAVKNINSGKFISSAMTKSTVIGSTLIFKK